MAQPMTPASGGDPEELLLTPEQASPLIKKTPNWLRRQAYARTIPHHRIGRTILFSREDLQQIKAEGAQPARRRTRKRSA
ncbi:helix-turn-helix domain-containing protein [Actinomadura sp. KC216]|uniref:helix-turn-helix domain-containing protein n=1 Tax=Actinomadura sp. KC216 TaxID=2530370 RepID=UPI0014049552|nr:helix-turn-helix domain-containing protein [Actinomadura sp. KC216]